MHTLTINIKDNKTTERVVWFLQHLQQDGVEIVDKEDFEDLKALVATRKEGSVTFQEYLKNDN